MPPPRTKRCPGCCPSDQTLPVADFPRNRSRPDGHGSLCKTCHAERQAKRDAVRTDQRDADDVEAIERARRLASDTEALRIEDLDEYDVSVANDPRDGRQSAQASREKRQEFNRHMGAHAEDLKRAAGTAHQRGGDVLSGMSASSASYIGKLAEQERRFQNRRLARTISLAQASEALNLRLYKQVAEQFFSNKITATGFAKRAPNKTLKRSAVLLLSDLHFGAELSSLDEPMPFRAIEESRRLEFLLRETIDFKPQYRANTELVLLINGDVIEGQLMHQIGAGAPLTEQKAIFWSYFRPFIAEVSAAFPAVRVFCEPGNHGRDKVRHPGRATWRKWDGHEFELYYALQMMCSGLRNVTFRVPFRAVAAVPLHGAILGLTHGDTEIKIGHPDKAAEKNAAQINKVNATRVHGAVFDAFAFGHFHTGRVHYGPVTTVYNGALVPPNGHARAEGYIGEACGQFLWEAVEGHPVGDLRFLQVGPSQDRDEKLGTIIKPFRFPTEG